MSIKKNIIGVSIAFVIVGCATTYALGAFIDVMTPAQAAETKDTFTSTYKDGTTFEYSVNKPLLSTQYVQLIYKSEGEPPAYFEAYVDKSQALYNSITTQNDINSLLNYIHLRFNSVGIGNGLERLKKTGVDGHNAWDNLKSVRWMDVNFYLRLAEVVDNPKVSKDFKNVVALVNIANTKQDAQAVDYIHRIIHDLDKWVYDNMYPGEEVSHFGATHAEDGAQVKEIEAYIIEYSTHPALTLDVTP